VPIALIYRHNVDFVLCGTAAWDAAVDSSGLLVAILWLANGCIRINLHSTSECIRQASDIVVVPSATEAVSAFAESLQGSILPRTIVRATGAPSLIT